jgi:hypothetical protein
MANNRSSFSSANSSVESHINKRHQFYVQDSQDQEDFSQADPITESRSGLEDFVYINEKPVDDVSLTFFYQPRTLTTLCLVILVFVQVAFQR